jgi:hypothetical protein
MLLRADPPLTLESRAERERTAAAKRPDEFGPLLTAADVR